MIVNIKEPEQTEEEQPETTHAEVVQNPETIVQTAEETESKYKVFDGMSEDWGSDDLEGFVLYKLPEQYADKGYFPEKMQIYTRCLCKQNDVPYLKRFTPTTEQRRSSTHTGNMRAGLKAAGFEVLTDSKYLTSDAYLLEGDILLNDNAHVATNLTDGAKSSGAGASNTTPVKNDTKTDVAYGFDKKLAGEYKVTASALNLRAGAGTGKTILAVMNNGEKVHCYGYYNDCNGVKWLYVVYKNIVGYASSRYLNK